MSVTRAAATARRRGTRIRLNLGMAIAYIILVSVTIVTVAPLIWTFFSSLKPLAEITGKLTLFPETWTLANYEAILKRVNFLRAALNSAIVSSVVTISVLITSSAAGYVFAKYRFWAKDQIFTVILATMMVPFAVVLIPLYVTVAQMGLANKLSGIIVTALCSTFGIFMMRQFMESIPSELIDAGRIDGAAEWWIFGRVVLPLATSPLGALAVFTFLGQWDNFLWPSVVLTSPKTQTLPLLLAGLRNLFLLQYDLFTAGAMLTVIPVMLLYSIAQQQFIRGIAMTGLKF
ncbi:MAG: carbohydrate ABC transporter permease [Anaerolineae bacterium]